MRTLRIRKDGAGNPRLESLPLPFLSPGPTATETERALAPDPDSVTAVEAMRAKAVPGGWNAGLAGDRRLYLLLSGTLRVSVPHMQARLGAGDVLLVDLAEDGPIEGRLHADTNLQVIEVKVQDRWRSDGIVPPQLEEARRGPRTAARLVHLVSVNEVAHLADLPDIFATGAEQRVDALSFVCLSPEMTSDWHTEPGVSLLFVLSGGFEIEVGGTGGRVTLRAGDLCLVEDFDGQGHRSTSDGETRFAVLSLPRNHRIGVGA